MNRNLNILKCRVDFILTLPYATGWLRSLRQTFQQFCMEFSCLVDSRLFSDIRQINVSHGQFSILKTRG